MTLEATLAGGELAIALKELVHALANNKTAISSSEYQQLFELIEYLEDTQLTEKLKELERE